ncbi:MAG: hypothetical protein A2Y41_07910 [Spirochaetes bacterium GWB1_36_13]|nr:MAG: hypothetical protein A2Y41_07910 [Spirochaetes bacterium GWB1_36_13]
MKTQFRKYQIYFLKIILPAFLVLTLFIAFFFKIVLPSLENSFIKNKKEMLKELSNSAISILNKSVLEAKQLKMDLNQAQKMALERIQFLHYGAENKDYFWITDFEPKMIMHPYRKDLIGKNLMDFQDPNGKRVFIELRDLARKQKEGYLEYYWQWMDNPEKIEPKLSYIKVFEPWNWIIGTGMYLTDIKKEISEYETSFYKISFSVLFMITVLFFMIVFYSFKTEKNRKKVELELIQTERKYQLTVEASSDGFILLLKNTLPFYNDKLKEILGYENYNKLNLKDIIFSENSESLSIDIDDFESKYENNIQFEAKIKKFNGKFLDVLLSLSIIDFQNQKGFMIIIKDLSNVKAIERKNTDSEDIFVELQSSLLLLNRPLSHFMKEYHFCLETDSIKQAAQLMSLHQCDAILVADQNNKFSGIITEMDFRTKLIEKDNFDTSQTVKTIMSDSFIVLQEKSSVFEAMLHLQDSPIKHIVIENEEEKTIGFLSETDIFEIQANSYAKIIQEIKTSSSIQEIVETKKKITSVIHTLAESGANPRNLSLFLTRLSDSVTRKIIEFGIRDTGTPPVHFSFMALGSNGREEETLLTDQDNILIYDDCDPSIQEKAAAYFLALGTYISDKLNECGYDYCKGNIMAKNPVFNQPFSTWKNYFKKWIQNPDPQSLLEIHIFFDFRTVYSTFQEEKFHKKDLFAFHLRDYIHKLLEEKPDFYIYLAKNALHYRPQIGFLGNILLEDKEGNKDIINIKESLVLIVNFARIYCLKNNISSTNTLDRLRILHEKNFLQTEIYNEINHVYNYFMQLRFKNQVKMLENNKTPNNYIEVKKLTNIEYSILKKMLLKMRIFQVRLNIDFLGGISF